MRIDPPETRGIKTPNWAAETCNSRWVRAPSEDQAVLKVSFWDKEKGASRSSIPVDVSQYRLLDEPLDDIFIHYLAETVPHHRPRELPVKFLDSDRNRSTM
jgi:hypothetical protein